MIVEKSFAELVALGMGYKSENHEDAVKWIKEHPYPDDEEDVPIMCDFCKNDCKSKNFVIMACVKYDPEEYEDDKIIDIVPDELLEFEDDVLVKKKRRLPKIHGAKEKRYIP